MSGEESITLVKEEFFQNMKVLKYDQSTKWRSNCTLTRDMFDKPDVLATQSVIIFTLHCIDLKKAKKEFSSFFPISAEKSVLIDFRKRVKEWILALKNEPEFKNTFRALDLPVLAGIRFYTFLAALSGYALRSNLADAPILRLGANSDLLRATSRTNERQVLRHDACLQGWTDFSQSLETEVEILRRNNEQMEKTYFDLPCFSDDLEFSKLGHVGDVTPGGELEGLIHFSPIRFPSKSQMESLCEQSRVVSERTVIAGKIRPNIERVKLKVEDICKEVDSLYEFDVPRECKEAVIGDRSELEGKDDLIGIVMNKRKHCRSFDHIVDSVRRSLLDKYDPPDN